MLGETVDKELTMVEDIAEIALLLVDWRVDHRQPWLAHELIATGGDSFARNPRTERMHASCDALQTSGFK
jgi:hypothetical protein